MSKPVPHPQRITVVSFHHKDLWVDTTVEVRTRGWGSRGAEMVEVRPPPTA